jgi:hypothetical protein
LALTAGTTERLKQLRLYVNHAFLILQLARDQEKPAPGDDNSILLKDIRGNNDVSDSSFVLK